MTEEHRYRPLLVYDYERYLIDQDIDRYLYNVTARYGVGSLERVATNTDRAARRGAVLALGRLGDYQSNTVMGRALIDSDRGVRTLAESGIRRLWSRIGTPTQQRHLVAIGEHLDRLEFSRAAQLSTAIVEDAPWIAQAWYYRGKAFYHMDQFDAATRDCHQSLEINPYHFLAASLMGQAYLRLNDPVLALESFRRTLRLNPNMEDVRSQVIQLQRSLKDER